MTEKILFGVLLSHWETGMEEVQAVFQDEKFIDPKTGQYAYAGLHQIYEGMHLTCWDANRCLLFDGIIKFSFFDNPKLPKGWEQWFVHRFRARIAWPIKSFRRNQQRYLLIK